MVKIRLDFKKKLEGYELNFNKPVDKRFDTLKCLRIAIDDYITQNYPAEKLSKHPTADSYPGAPEKPSRVEGTFTIDSDKPGRMFTGYYAAPGEVVTIELPENASKGQFNILVGAHSDSTLPRPSLKRFPKITRTFKVDKAGPVKVANSFGGLIYIVSKDKNVAAKLGKVTGKVSGACKAPYFIAGKTSSDDWQKIRQYDAPWAEIESSHLIFTVPSSSIRNLDNPQELMDYWVRISKAQDDLAGYTEMRTHAERIVFDKQISAGSLHAGYPIMGHVGQEKNALDLAHLKDKGNWGIFHELGHNHQRIFPGGYNNFWTFDVNIEVTVNIYSAYTYYAVLKKDVQAHEYWRPQDLAENLKKNFVKGKKYGEQSNKTRALFFVHLVNEFGWQSYKKMFREFWKHPKESGPKSDLEERTLFLEIFSKVTGKNLAPFFDSWGLEYDKKVLAKIKDLAAFTPKVSLEGAIN